MSIAASRVPSRTLAGPSRPCAAPRAVRSRLGRGDAVVNPVHAKGFTLYHRESSPAWAETVLRYNDKATTGV